MQMSVHVMHSYANQVENLCTILFPILAHKLSQPQPQTQAQTQSQSPQASLSVSASAFSATNTASASVSAKSPTAACSPDATCRLFSRKQKVLFLHKFSHRFDPFARYSRQVMALRRHGTASVQRP